MDYKDLIKRLKSETYWLGSSQPYSRDVHPVICDEAVTAITDLLSRAEGAEARCALLDEARENANEACAKWEGMYRMALERAEKAEAEKDSICKYIDSKSELRRYFCKSRNDSLEDSNCPSIKKHYSYIDSYDCWKCKQFHNSWAGVKEE